MESKTKPDAAITTASWIIAIENEFDFKLLHHMFLWLNVQILNIHILGSDYSKSYVEWKEKKEDSLETSETTLNALH